MFEIRTPLKQLPRPTQFRLVERQTLEEFCRLEDESARKHFLTIFAGYLLLQRVFCDQDWRMRRALLDEAIAAIARAFAEKHPDDPAGEQTNAAAAPRRPASPPLRAPGCETDPFVRPPKEGR